jgi:hypothetical protein
MPMNAMGQPAGIFWRLWRMIGQWAQVVNDYLCRINNESGNRGKSSQNFQIYFNHIFWILLHEHKSGALLWWSKTIQTTAILVYFLSNEYKTINRFKIIHSSHSLRNVSVGDCGHQRVVLRLYYKKEELRKRSLVNVKNMWIYKHL